jgi:phospholipid/cholesterol/gamma-HCH transport system substrate-binding protein
LTARAPARRWRRTSNCKHRQAPHPPNHRTHGRSIIETKVSYSIVGAFVMVPWVRCWWRACSGWRPAARGRRKYDLYRAVMDESVAGLNLNAPVKFNGVDVGKVRVIELDHANPNRVNLLFAIERGTPVREDTIAVLKTQGLTGIAYVELSGGAADSPPLGTCPATTTR